MIYGDSQLTNILSPNTNAITQSVNLYLYCMGNPVQYIDATGDTAAFILGCTIVGALGNGIAQVVTNLATGQSWNEGVLTAVASGAVSGAVFGATLNVGAAVAAGTLVTAVVHTVEGVANGDSASNIGKILLQDAVNGLVSYGANRIAGAFIKTNNGWFQPRGIKAFFTKSYGQKIIQQTAIAGAITSSTVTMYDNGKRDVVAIQEFLGINADGSYGPQTKAAVIEFQKHLLETGYLDKQMDQADGDWGPRTDAAFTWYIRQNVTFMDT